MIPEGSHDHVLRTTVLKHEIWGQLVGLMRTRGSHGRIVDRVKETFHPLLLSGAGTSMLAMTVRLNTTSRIAMKVLRIELKKISF